MQASCYKLCPVSFHSRLLSRQAPLFYDFTAAGGRLVNFYSGQLAVQTSQQATGAGYGFKFHIMPIFNLGQNNQFHVADAAGSHSGDL